MVNMPVKLVFSSVKSLKRSAAADYWFHGAKVMIKRKFKYTNCTYFIELALQPKTYSLNSNKFV